MKDITPPGSGSERKKRFRCEKEFVCWIKDNSDIVFGEEMCWKDSPKLPGAQGKDIKPDLMGWDSKGNIVIVEVKYFKLEEEIKSEAKKFSDRKKRFRKISDYRTNKRITIDKSVGQILRYAYGYMMKCISEDLSKPVWNKLSNTLRLFIITPEGSLDIGCICEFLQAGGLNICHIQVPEETKNENDKV